MSVYKSKRGESSVQFIETARQLEAHTFACCMKAPKRYERFLTGRIMELSSEVHDRVRAANNIWPTNRHEAQLRRDELMRANNALQNLSPKLQLPNNQCRENSLYILPTRCCISNTRALQCDSSHSGDNDSLLP